LIWGGPKLGNLTSKHIKANICKNDCTCACNRLSIYRLYLNGNAKKVVIVVKRYAVLEAEKMRYARPKEGGTQYPRGRGGPLIQEFDQYEDHKMPIKNTLNSNTS